MHASMNGSPYRPRTHADELDRARAALTAIDPSCDRDSWVRIGMAARSAGLDLADFDAWSATGANYSGERDTTSVWRSFDDAGAVTPASLFAAARAAGWSDQGERLNGARNGHSGPRRTAQAAPIKPGKPKVPSFDFRAVWRDAEPATEAHGYVHRKLGLPLGLRVYRGPLKVAGQPLDGALLVPAFDVAGDLQSWQAIPAEPGAKKLNAPGASMSGARFIVGGTPRDGDPLYLAEGISAAWSAHQATSKPAVCCFGAGNVECVADDLHARHQGARIIIVADRGKETQSERIAREVGGAWVGLPEDWPSNSDVNDLHQRDGLDAVAQLLAQATEPVRRYKLMTAEELAALPPVRWRVRGVLPAEGIGAVYGPAGSGKSFLVLDMLGAVAEAREWFGHRTDAAPVTYLALEGEAGIAQRVAAYRERHGQAPAWMRFIAQAFALLEPGDVAELADAIRAAGGAGGIVAIDTLNRASPGADENSSQDMSAIIAGAKALQSALGGLVLLVHHTGKDAARGLRGHSSLHGALDAAVEVTRDGDRREWRTAKAKDDRDGDAHPFRLGVVELGSDEHGEPITSCVIEPEESAGDAVRRVKLPQGGNQRLVWDALGEHFRHAADFAQAGAPPGRPCLRLDDAVERCRGRLTCTTDRQTHRAREAIAGLVSRGVLALREGWVWCP